MLAIVFPQIDPVLLHIAGPISIRWYALAYFIGIISGAWLLHIFNKQDKRELFSKNIIEDITFYSIFGIILGGRIGHVMIYDHDDFLDDPIMLFKIWRGGMSFHGGLLGLVISLYLISKKHQIEFLYLTDLIACVAPIGIFFGRLANFINAELYGRPTNLEWGMIFPNVDNIPRHPSQIYEASMEGFLLLIIMLFLRFKTNYKMQLGALSGAFMTLYGIFRFVAEYYREPDYHIGFIIGNLTVGQLLSLPIFIVGLSLTLRAHKNTLQ